RRQRRNPKSRSGGVVAGLNHAQPDIAIEVSKRPAIIHAEAKEPITGQRLLGLVVEAAADIVGRGIEVEVRVGRERGPAPTLRLGLPQELVGVLRAASDQRSRWEPQSRNIPSGASEEIAEADQ